MYFVEYIQNLTQTKIIIIKS